MHYEDFRLMMRIGPRSKLQDLALAFEQVLVAGAEERIQEFIAANQHVLDFLDWDRWRWSKFRLGTSFVTDFVSVGRTRYSNNPRALVTFVEIERADVP